MDVKGKEEEKRVEKRKKREKISEDGGRRNELLLNLKSASATGDAASVFEVEAKKSQNIRS